MSTVQLSTCKQEQYAQNRSNWSNQNIRYVIEGFSKSTLLLYDLIESESFFLSGCQPIHSKVQDVVALHELFESFQIHR